MSDSEDEAFASADEGGEEKERVLHDNIQPEPGDGSLEKSEKHGVQLQLEADNRSTEKSAEESLSLASEKYQTEVEQSVSFDEVSADDIKSETSSTSPGDNIVGKEDTTEFLADEREEVVDVLSSSATEESSVSESKKEPVATKEKPLRGSARFKKKQNQTSKKSQLKLGEKIPKSDFQQESNPQPEALVSELNQPPKETEPLQPTAVNDAQNPEEIVEEMRPTRVVQQSQRSVNETNDDKQRRVLDQLAGVSSSVSQPFHHFFEHLEMFHKKEIANQ